MALLRGYYCGEYKNNVKIKYIYCENWDVGGKKK